MLSMERLVSKTQDRSETVNPRPYSDISVEEMVTRYAEMKHFANGMYLEAMWQYRDMARGGDGGLLGYTPSDWARRCVDNMRPIDGSPSCRAYNYPDYPDAYFSEVLTALGEAY
jgi:hypothetical protein